MLFKVSFDVLYSIHKIQFYVALLEKKYIVDLYLI